MKDIPDQKKLIFGLLKHLKETVFGHDIKMQTLKNAEQLE
jgi:hypothetical protein